MPAVVLTTDLLLQSQLSGAAARAGQSFQVVASVEALLAKLAASPHRLIILDLALDAIQPAALVQQLRLQAPSSTIVAFGPHVHRQRLADAKAAGCDVVMSRGQFHAEAESLLQSAAE
ncbi:MAG: hypothetical protein WD845_15480 [Pirellulales bacterium]